MNILITSASRKVSLVRAFQSALARHGGGQVIAVDASSNAPALYIADEHFLVPLTTEGHFISELLQLCQLEEVDLLVPTRDEELPVFADAREHFEAAGIRVMVSSAKTVRICQDKSAFVSFCVEQRFPVPLRYTRDGARGAKFPLFLKPRFGKGGMGARRIFTENELRDITESDDECIIQEFVSAPEYTIDLFADFNGRVLSAVPRLRQLVIGGESYVSRTVNEPRLIEESMRLATALDLTGHCTIQCFWDSHELKFIEVNPRFGGGTALSIAAGADSPSMLVQLLAGEDVPDRIGKFVNDLVMLRFTDDLFLKAGMMPAQPPGEPELCSSSKSPHTQP